MWWWKRIDEGTRQLQDVTGALKWWLQGVTLVLKWIVASNAMCWRCSRLWGEDELSWRWWIMRWCWRCSRLWRKDEWRCRWRIMRWWKRSDDGRALMTEWGCIDALRGPWKGWKIIWSLRETCGCLMYLFLCTLEMDWETNIREKKFHNIQGYRGTLDWWGENCELNRGWKWSASRYALRH